MRLTKWIPAAWKESVRSVLRDRAIERALRPLRATGTMTAAQIAAFHNSWQDTGFAADCSYLTRLLRFLENLKSSDAVLECGSGGTTLLADVTGTQRGFRTYSLEQDPEWALPVQRWLKGSAHILDAPLKNFPTYHWYDVREALPMHFALIICDGPYIDKTLGEPAHSAWRFGVLPWLSQTGRTFDALLLDDVNDARGPALLERWQKEFGVTVERLASPEGECAIVRPRGLTQRGSLESSH